MWKYKNKCNEVALTNNLFKDVQGIFQYMPQCHAGRFLTALSNQSLAPSSHSGVAMAYNKTHKKGFLGGKRVWGWGYEHAAGERTIFQPLEQHDTEHAYYVQVCQDPKQENFS